VYLLLLVIAQDCYKPVFFSERNDGASVWLFVYSSMLVYVCTDGPENITHFAANQVHSKE